MKDSVNKEMNEEKAVVRWAFIIARLFVLYAGTWGAWMYYAYPTPAGEIMMGTYALLPTGIAAILLWFWRIDDFSRGWNVFRGMLIALGVLTTLGLIDFFILELRLVEVIRSSAWMTISTSVTLGIFEILLGMDQRRQRQRKTAA